MPDGRQHNTYDIEFYGANPLSTLYYLAGMKAGVALAQVMGDSDSAARWGAICARGQQQFIADCWNGDYFIQKMPDVARRRSPRKQPCPRPLHR